MKTTVATQLKCVSITNIQIQINFFIEQLIVLLKSGLNQALWYPTVTRKLFFLQNAALEIDLSLRLQFQLKCKKPLILKKDDHVVIGSPGSQLSSQNLKISLDFVRTNTLRLDIFYFIKLLLRYYFVVPPFKGPFK